MAKKSSPQIKLLSSQYWLVSWGPYIWLQWPLWREPTLDDAFGWVTAEMLRQAVELTRREAMRKSETPLLSAGGVDTGATK
jgi:hypothetical protein